MGVDRQRRFPRSRSAFVRRAGGRGRDAGTGRDRGRRCPGAQRLGHRRARRAQHYLRLHRRRDLPDAPPEPLDRSDLARRGPGTPGDRRRDARAPGRLGAGIGPLPRGGPESRQAGVQRRRGPGAPARARRDRARGRCAAPPSGSCGASAADRAPPAWRAQPGDDRAPRRVRRRRAGRSAARREEPGERTDRGPHDRRQRRDGEIPGGARPAVPAPGAPLARTMGAHRRAGGGARRDAARGAGRRGPRGIPVQASPGRPGQVPGPLPRGRQADGPGRVPGGAPGRRLAGALRSRGPRLHPLHGAVASRIS